MPPQPGQTPPARRARRIALIGLLTNLGLSFAKLVAGLLGHSTALVADAVESLTDAVGSIVIWGGLHIAARPADENHPYGHGKAEAVAAMLVSLMVAGAGVAIAVQAVHGIVQPRPAPRSFTLAVLIVVVIVKEVMFRVARRASRELDSGAVHVDAWHHRSDAITSAAAFVGITVALVGGPGYEQADAWAALAASAVILVNAWLLFRVPMRELMDEEPAGIVERARELAMQVAGVRALDKVAARKSGTRYWVDMHLRVDPDMSVRDGHALAHRVKDHIRAAMPNVQDVLLHVEPHEPR